MKDDSQVVQHRSLRPPDVLEVLSGTIIRGYNTLVSIHSTSCSDPYSLANAKLLLKMAPPYTSSTPHLLIEYLCIRTQATSNTQSSHHIPTFASSLAHILNGTNTIENTTTAMTGP